MSNNVLLNIDSVVIGFLHNRRVEDYEEAVNRSINLSVAKGSVTALIGGNGSGKTSLFNVISGFLKPQKGRISYYKNAVNPVELLSLPPYMIPRIGLGRMFQDNHIFHDMTVMENMLVADENRFGENPFEPFLFFKRNNEIEKKREEEVREKFNLLFGEYGELSKKLYHKAGSLSHGQQRLLGLARLLMGNYELLLLDEPTSGVSPQLEENIKALFKYFVEEESKTIFFIEHNIEFVLYVADQCFFMDDGMKKFSGTPREVLNIPEVRLDYLGV